MSFLGALDFVYKALDTNPQEWIFLVLYVLYKYFD